MRDLVPFLWTFLASSLLAAALAAAGAHVASRQRTLQSLCLAQGGEMGALVSIFVAHISHDFLYRGDTWFGLGGSLLGSLFAGAAALKIAGSQVSSRTPRLFAFWVALIAATHLSVSLHPVLESHLARVFLGDLATLSNSESLTLAGFGGFALIVLLFGHSFISRETFDLVALGKKSSSGNFVRRLIFSYFPFLLLPAVSTWGAGFLFTCGLLFIPSAFLALSGDTSKCHVYLCAIVGAVSAPIGLFLSLKGDQIPTVPAMAGILALGCFCVRVSRGLWRLV